MTVWIIGRAYCSVCRVVRQIVAHPDAIVHCPRCGTRCASARGLDDVEEE